MLRILQTYGIFLLFLTMPIGPYFLPISMPGFSLYGFRYVTLSLFFLSLALIHSFRWLGNAVTRRYMMMMCLWILWGLISITWTNDFISAVKELSFLLFAAVLGYVFFSFGACTKRGIHTIRIGWAIAYIVAGAFAVWEMFTNEHLPSQLVEKTRKQILDFIVISTFQNPNNYAAFIAFTLPFLIWSFKVTESRVGKISWLCLLITVPIFMVETGSKVGLLCMMIQISIFGLFSFRRIRSFGKFIFVFAIFSMAAYPFMTQDSYIVKKLSKVDMGAFGPGGALNNRFKMLINGLWLTERTGGLGGGAGSYETYHAQGILPYETRGCPNPHNLFIEIVSQYGIFIFILFLAWLVYLFWLSLSIGHYSKIVKDVNTKIVSDIMILGLPTFPLIGLANSSSLNQNHNWLFLASMAAMGGYLWRRRQYIARCNE